MVVRSGIGVLTVEEGATTPLAIKQDGANALPKSSDNKVRSHYLLINFHDLSFSLEVFSMAL